MEGKKPSESTRRKVIDGSTSDTRLTMLKTMFKDLNERQASTGMRVSTLYVKLLSESRSARSLNYQQQSSGTLDVARIPLRSAVYSPS
jgi:hypothetical protein